MRPQEHTKIVILADLGTMRAIRLSPENAPLAPHQGPAMVEELTLPTDDKNTDRPSRFPLGHDSEESKAMSPGENHHEKAENEKRRIQFLASEIEAILAQEDSMLWCLAAPAAINKRILAQLAPETLEFLGINLKSDLAHITLRELEERFLKASA